METIALRFGEHFAPNEGTIASHQEIINKYGFVWYGKMGAAVSDRVITSLQENEVIKILLIRSGRSERYWAVVSEIQHNTPEKEYIPEYYRDIAGTFKTWFKISEFVPAEKDVLGRCFVSSSGAPLNEVSKHSMSPYFIIDYKG